MAPKIMILALVFFAMACMASAIDLPAAALKDAADAPIAVENNNIIEADYKTSHQDQLKGKAGTINGSHDNGAVAAAPVGGPIAGHTFPNITLPPAPNGATTSTPDFTTIATAIVSAAVAASFFY